MSTLNLRNPNGYNGQPATQFHQGIVRFATLTEVTEGTANNVAVTPANLTGSTAGNFAAPPILGSTTPNTVHATVLSSTGNSGLSSNAGATLRLGNTTGTLGFFGSAGTTRGTQAALTNSVTAGGTTGTIANFTDLSTYATDAPTIRNDIYQLSLALTNIVTILRAYGMVA